MEWVETSGKTVEAAKDLALNELGVGESDAEIEVLEEPKQGLFGRVRGNARVKARIAPVSTRPKQEKRRSGKEGNSKPKRDSASNDDGKSDSGRSKAPAKKTSNRGSEDSSDKNGSDRKSDGGRNKPKSRDRADRADREMMPAQEQCDVGDAFLNGLLQAFGLEGTVDSDLDSEGILSLDINGQNLGLLMGPGLGTLESVQEICRNSIQHAAGGREYGKVRLDVAGARGKRTLALEEFTRTQAANVLEVGEQVVFEPMSRLDRKVVHDLVTDLDGVDTESVGDEPRRSVVIRTA